MLCLWLQVIYSAFGSFFIPMSIMLYVYSKIFCVLTSRQSRLSRTEVSVNKLYFFLNILITRTITSIPGMWTCHRRRKRVRNVRSWLKLPSKLKGPHSQHARSPTDDALRTPRICKNSLDTEEQQLARRCQQQFQPRKFRDSFAELRSVQSKSTIQRELVNQVKKENSHTNFILKERNENRPNIKVRFFIWDSFKAFTLNSHQKCLFSGHMNSRKGSKVNGADST